MRPLAAIMLFATALALAACQTPAPRTPVRLSYTFENMRRFVDPQGNPISHRDEWALVEDLIHDLRAYYHVRDNRYAAAFNSTRTVDEASPAEVQIATYKVDLVVSDLDRIDDINQRINALRGRRFGPSREAAQVDPYEAAVAYRSGFLRADLRVILSGDAEPGTVVYLYDRVLEDPLRVLAGPQGRWESAVNVGEGQRFVYAYFVDPRAKRPVFFRVHIGTREFQELARSTVEADFPSDYGGRRFHLAPPE